MSVYMAFPNALVLCQSSAHPVVSVTCVKGPDGSFPKLLLCIAEGFYPAALEQAWIRDGEYITYLNTSHTLTNRQYLNTSDIHWNYSINADGSYRLMSYLQLPSHTPEHSVYCSVNHMSLSQPVTVNISSIACFEGDVWWRGKKFQLQFSLLLYAFAGWSCSRSSRGDLPPHVPTSPSQMQIELYSTLGNHQPVPCQSSTNHTRTPTFSQRWTPTNPAFHSA
uniref:Ig-like domain-containing protein n=1 Tax=Electrophorus electricus TaxID=8005 RepID=A0AAY5EEE6_ELEEL